MVAQIENKSNPQSLKGRTLYVPQMAYAGARLFAATFRSFGIDAAIAPDSDAETLEIGGLYSSGEECLPHKVTLGDFLKVCRRPDFDPKKTAFLMVTAHGPCRFGQYAPYLKKTLRELGYGEAMVFSPTSKNGYDGVGENATELTLMAWTALVVGDILTKFLLKTRPYESTAGDTDTVYNQSIDEVVEVLAQPGKKPRQKLASLVEMVKKIRDRFRGIPARYTKDRPLIGLVGEIFCRHNNFSNDDIARRIEKFGGECWISDISEWVWYTNWYQKNEILDEQGRFSRAYLAYKLKTHFQHKYEHKLLAPVKEDFRGYEEPAHIEAVLDRAEKYLPSEGCIGEMVLSTGKAMYLHGKGADGIVDISPFTCMNGIICEAVYPAISAAHDDLPVRMFYFDGINANVDRDIEIFLDLARAYQSRKKHPRVYPDCFEGR